jgi:hypothetical protein
MPALHDDLSDLARSIVHGEQPSSQIAASYRNYSVDVAVEVYRNNYRGNLHDALAGAYPVIEQLVGRDFFRHITRQFITKHTSRSGNLHHYGAEMADFVATFEPAQGLVYLPDVAALEWACHCAYFADDGIAPDIGQTFIAKLAQIPPGQYPDLILYAHPSCHLVRSSYPVASIWHAHQPGALSDFHIDLDSGFSNALVSRNDDVVMVNELSPADADWLHGILSGTPLGEATAATLQRYPDFDLQATLLSLVAQGVLIDFNLSPRP